MSNLRIPPLIEGWVAEMNNEKVSQQIRNNRCLMLEELNKHLDEQINKFRRTATFDNKRQKETEPMANQVGWPTRGIRPD